MISNFVVLQHFVIYPSRTEGVGGAHYRAPLKSLRADKKNAEQEKDTNEIYTMITTTTKILHTIPIIAYRKLLPAF